MLRKRVFLEETHSVDIFYLLEMEYLFNFLQKDDRKSSETRRFDESIQNHIQLTCTKSKVFVSDFCTTAYFSPTHTEFSLQRFKKKLT